jgi:polyisoprenoid-binding protein YceI
MKVQFFACGLLLTSASAMASTWNIDAAHTYGHFKVRHMMVTNVSGQIAGATGTVELDEKDVTKSKVTASLDASTVDTNNAKRDEHLKNADFFNVPKCKDIKFVSKSVSGAIPNLKVVGALTLNCVTKDVELTIDGPTAPVKTPFGDTRRGLTATGKINRKDFNMVWNKAMDGNGVVVGEDVALTIEAELIAK